MKIVKYSKIKDGQINASNIVGGGGGSSSSTTIEGSSTSLDRMIWGKHDEGEDIDGHMIVNGDITIKGIEYDWDDSDDDDDGEDVDYDEGGGNLIVELKTTTKDIDVENDAYVKNHLYINYNNNHSHSENKKCLGEILNGIETNVEINKNNIASNLTEINNLKSRVSTNETNISNNTTEINNLKSRMSDAETMINSLDENQQADETAIRNNAEEIAKLKQRSDSSETDLSDITTRVENNETNISNNTTEINLIKEQMADGSAIDQLKQQIESLKYGNYSNPVILYSGVLRKLSTSDIYTNNGSYKDCMLFSIKEINEGVMTIELSKSSLTDKNINIFVTSISAIQQMSNDTDGRENYYKERSNGAHWFEAWVGETLNNKTTIYLREFHQGNGDNDTWYSSSWTENGGIRAVNLTINGYISFLS